jgi:glycosyltransferase involved in cell wall biosynthesis
MGKKIFFTVTNDLTYDQRMQRICGSLAAAGYDITLVGRKLPGSLPLSERRYKQKRLPCWFQKGKWFYAEFNIRLLFYLLFKKMDAICAIDLDTILPCLRISKWKKIPRIYDAHELFTGLKEVATRPAVLRAWTRIEKKAVPQFNHGYTVSRSIAEEFRKRYDVSYQTIRNVPVMRQWSETNEPEKFLLYQGAVNEARGFEYLIPAMKGVNARLIICGDGNFMSQLLELIREYEVEDKIILKGMLPAEELWDIARRSYIAIGIAENNGLNQYLALPNKFFDYIHAGLPQITMDYPEYRHINQQFEVALLLDNVAPERISQTINNLLGDTVLYKRLQDNCLRARQVLNWQEEEKKLVAFYKTVFNH